MLRHPISKAVIDSFTVIRVSSVLLIYLASPTTGQELKFSTSMPTSPDFYQGEPLVLACNTMNKPSLGVFWYDMVFADNIGGGESKMGCTLSENQARNTGTSPQDLDVTSSIDSDFCELLLSDSQWSMQVTVLTTTDLAKYNIYCKLEDIGEDIGGTAGTVESQEPHFNLEAAKVKIAPSGLKITEPGTVIEAREFTVTCEANAATPTSVYQYDVLHGEDVIQTNIAGGRYTPTVDDRRGFTVRCRDIMHSNWRTPADIEATSEIILPQYIDIGGDGDPIPTKSLNPTYNTSTLTCNIIAHTGTVISYTWTSSVVREAEFTTRDLTLSPRENGQKGDTEEIRCEGSVDGLTKSITWTITWNMETTTTPTPITTTPQKTKAGIYIGVAAAVVGVAIIVIIVVVCWRKHKAATGNKHDRDLALNTNGESKPKPQGRGRTPSKHSKYSTPLNQQHNDKPEIIYSDVQAINKPHPNTAMVRPHQRADKPPEVEYSSIDFLKTDAQKGKTVVPTGPEYELHRESA